LQGNGNGTFQPAQSFAAGKGNASIVTADLRGNGDIDLLLADQAAGAVLVLYGRGDNTFAAPISYAYGISPVSLTAGDFNGDGAADLAAADEQSTAIAVFYNQCGTQISLASSKSAPAAGQAVTFTTTLKPTFVDRGTPSGTVAFKDGDTALGTATLSEGKAAFTDSKLSKGTHRITAEYYGSSNFNPHTSAEVTVTVQ
jgi:hypothetical protein